MTWTSEPTPRGTSSDAEPSSVTALRRRLEEIELELGEMRATFNARLIHLGGEIHDLKDLLAAVSADIAHAEQPTTAPLATATFEPEPLPLAEADLLTEEPELVVGLAPEPPHEPLTESDLDHDIGATAEPEHEPSITDQKVPVVEVAKEEELEPDHEPPALSDPQLEREAASEPALEPQAALEHGQDHEPEPGPVPDISQHPTPEAEIEPARPHDVPVVRSTAGSDIDELLAQEFADYDPESSMARAPATEAAPVARGRDDAPDAAPAGEEDDPADVPEEPTRPSAPAVDTDDDFFSRPSN